MNRPNDPRAPRTPQGKQPDDSRSRQTPLQVSRSMRIRAGVVAGLVIAFFGVLVYVLYIYQIRDTQRYSTAAMNQQLADETIAPNRGTIYDANMKVLAQSSTVWTVVAAPSTLAEAETDLSALASKLAELLEMDYESVYARLTATNDEGALTNYQIIKRQVEKPVADAITSYISEYNAQRESNYISGITLEQSSKRYYPYGNFASTVLGFINVDGDGVIGLERRYNDVLKGTPGRVVRPQNAVGYDLPGTEYETMYDAQDGNSLVLTIDETIQQIVEKHLSAAVEQYSVSNRGVGIVMNVNTGEILAMSTKPDYDLNDPYTIVDPTVSAYVDSLTGEDKSSAQTEAWFAQWRNKAVSDIYFPGSVFKPVTTAMALDSGVASLDTTFVCSGTYTLDGHTYACAGHHATGPIALPDALNVSCNPYYIQLGLTIGPEIFNDYMEAFGFQERTGIDMDDEALTQTASLERLQSVPIDLASSSFGQTTAVTPIQMITAFSAVVNGGKLVQPHVVKQVLDPSGNVVEEVGTTVKRQVISEEVSSTISAILEESVASGHGNKAYVAGYKVGGKSGTSQKNQGISGDDEEQTYVASFIGFAPADDPEIAVLVFLDEPHASTTFGGSLCGPAVQKIMKEVLPYLGYAPEYTAEEAAMLEVNVPNLAGQTVDAASTTLVAQGLDYEAVGAGAAVVSQYPAAGTKVLPDSTIILYTEEGAEATVVMPDLSGMTGTQVQQALKAVNLNMSASGGDYTDTTMRAMYQNVAAGTEVPLGTVIEVEFGNPNLTE